MHCQNRAWRPRRAACLRPHVFHVGCLRVGALVPRSALRTPTSGAPLSLNDIIAFESDLTSRVVQEALPAVRSVDDIIDRASRVLDEVNSVLLPSQQQQRNDDADGGQAGEQQPDRRESGSGHGSELGRAVFGGSAQVSELQATLTRQALQKTLESSSSSSSSSSNGSLVGVAQAGGRDGNAGSASEQGAGTGAATGSGGPGAAAATERPAWAQALFSSSSPSTASNASSASASTSTSTPAKPSASSSRSPASLPLPGAGGSSAARSSPAAASPGRPPSTGAPSSSSATATATATAAPPLSPQLAAAPSRRLAAWVPLAFAEADLSLPTELVLKSEESLLAEAARSAVLPPLQSVVDLTAAIRPPTRGLDLDLGGGGAAAEAAVSDVVAVSEEEVVQGGALGRRLADGAGRLADGTRFEKLSGTDTGPDGYVKRWEVLRGVTGDGRVQWEECWWQASNRFGLRELGAFKKGTSESGASWVEEWKEVLRTHETNLRLVIERTAHKWARDEDSDEWEERWGECFEEAGRVHKWADKWAKAGINVWHERWGEDYDGRGACQKWTDKWAERLLPDGGQEQWGDKWTETFGQGRGTKHGEVWSSSGGGRYNRWWNEEHFGDGRVRKWGNSTSGEYWDTVENMDTYYNPVPHFGFQHAVGHSPQLWAVPLPPPDEGTGMGDDDDDGLGLGLGRL